MWTDWKAWSQAVALAFTILAISIGVGISFGKCTDTRNMGITTVGQHHTIDERLETIERKIDALLEHHTSD